LQKTIGESAIYHGCGMGQWWDSTIHQVQDPGVLHLKFVMLSC